MALVWTGWRHFGDATTYLSKDDGVPGVTPDGARWLAEAGVATTGADMTAYEQIEPGVGHSVLPVHRILLVDAGIQIIEHLALEEASAQGLAEFVLRDDPPAHRRRHRLTGTALRSGVGVSGPTVVQRLADLAVRTREDGLPDGLRGDVARWVLDLVGSSLAACG